LTELLAKLAVQLSDERRWSLTKAARSVLEQKSVWRERYRAAGAPFGDDDDGFARWLLSRGLASHLV